MQIGNGEAWGNLVQLEVCDNQRTLFQIHSLPTIHQLLIVKNQISEFLKGLAKPIILYVIMSVYSVLYTLFSNLIIIIIVFMHVFIYIFFFSLNTNN